MIKLLTLWAAFRLLRTLVSIVVIAMVVLLLLSSVNRTGSPGGVGTGRLPHIAESLKHQFQYAFQKAPDP